MEDKQESTNQQKKVSVGKATWEKLTKKASVAKNDDQNGSKGENDNPVKASKADSGRKTSAPVGERKVSATKEKWSSVTKKVSLANAFHLHHEEDHPDRKLSDAAAIRLDLDHVSHRRTSIDDEEALHKWIVEQRLNSNYYLNDGASKWHVIYPIANGKRQSPIDIVSAEVRSDPHLHPLEINYCLEGEGPVCTSVVNTGNQWKVNVDDKRTSFSGGSLSSEYRLIQFHAHWGTTAGAKGSEHTVNGKLFPAELHLVHWNTKYGLFTKAIDKPDGLAVIGIFMDIGDEDHPEMEKLTSVLHRIRYKNMQTTFDEPLDPAKLLPKDLSYWYYPGSLTTPPLDESVLWHVLRTPISISHRQLVAMATLQTGLNETEEDKMPAMINNFRPPVPLYERNVKLFDGERTKTYDEQKSKGEGSVKELKKEIEEMKQLLRENRQQDMTDVILSLKDSMQALQMTVAGLQGNQCPCHK